jgi:hypothetical protein
MKEDAETQGMVKDAVTEHQRLVVGDLQVRQETAMREIQAILKKYEVSLVPRAMLSPGGIEFMIETQAIDPAILEKQKAKETEQKAARKESKRKK